MLGRRERGSLAPAESGSGDKVGVVAHIVPDGRRGEGLRADLMEAPTVSLSVVVPGVSWGAGPLKLASLRA